MIFNKYEKRGAYHWDEYKQGTIYRDHVNKVLEWVRKGKTLDIGAGDGLITFMLDASGIDNNELSVQLAKERGANVKYGDAYHLACDELYDNILLMDVIEHFKEPDKVLRNIQKALVPNGLLYVTIPPKKESGLHDKYHYYEWSPDGFIAFMRVNNFECIDLEVIDKYVRMYGVFKSIIN